MKHMLLCAVAAFAVVLFATPARAQIFVDPDPCFDISMSKSQYEACVVDPGGYSGSGGAKIPPCMSCVTADWNGTGIETAACKDAGVYLASWPQYSDCQAYVSCWPGPSGPICETGCSGNVCLRI